MLVDKYNETSNFALSKLFIEKTNLTRKLMKTQGMDINENYQNSPKR